MIPFFGFSTFLLIVAVAIGFYIYAKFKNQLENLDAAKENMKLAFENRFGATQNLVSSLNGIVDPNKLKNFEETRIGSMGYDVFSSERLKMQAEFSSQLEDIFGEKNENINFIDQKTTTLENKTALEVAITSYQNERSQFFELIKSFPYSFFAGQVDKNLYPEI